MRCNDVLNNTSRPLSRLYDEYCNLLLTVALDPVEWSLFIPCGSRYAVSARKGNRGSKCCQLLPSDSLWSHWPVLCMNTPVSVCFASTNQHLQSSSERCYELLEPLESYTQKAGDALMFLLHPPHPLHWLAWDIKAQLPGLGAGEILMCNLCCGAACRIQPSVVLRIQTWDLFPYIKQPTSYNLQQIEKQSTLLNSKTLV